jgi:hypothetical protein
MLLFGLGNTSLAMLQSLSKIASGLLPGFPQDWISVSHAAALSPYYVNRLVLGLPVPHRMIFDFGETVDPEFNRERAAAQELAAGIASRMNLPVQ